MILCAAVDFWAPAALALVVFASSTGPRVDVVLAQAPSASPPMAIRSRDSQRVSLAQHRAQPRRAIDCGRGVKGRPREAYFGAVGGGLWKTVDAGNTWAPVTDGQITSSSVGAVAVSDSNPDIVYIGMGESCIRGNIMPGDGVYKSTDAGKTWTNIGFANVDAISQDPHPSHQPRHRLRRQLRPLRRTERRARRVQEHRRRQDVEARALPRSKTGAVDLAIDRRQPERDLRGAVGGVSRRVPDVERRPGQRAVQVAPTAARRGPRSRATTGLPAGVVGRIGVAVTGADSNRVYALVENENGGLFVSDDAGATWRLVNAARSSASARSTTRTSHADPNNKDIVYLLNTALFRSTDGGKTLARSARARTATTTTCGSIRTTPSTSSIANDGGGAITYNMSPAAAHVERSGLPDRAVLPRDHDGAPALPRLRRAAGQQHAVRAEQHRPGGGFGGIPPVAALSGGRRRARLHRARSHRPRRVLCRRQQRHVPDALNRRTGELKEVGAYPRFFSGEPSKDVKERWQWTYPIIFSYVDPKVLYTSSQRVWRSTNGGDTWEAISGDLTRHDPKTMQESGGPITHDMNSPEIYGTVFSLAPGKKDINVMWAGSDDGARSRHARSRQDVDERDAA